MLKETLTA